VDEGATEKLRRAHRGHPQTFEFGPERDAWEQVFDDVTTTELATRLLRLPATMQAQTRERIITRVVPGIERVGEVELQDLITDRAAQRALLKELIDALPVP
jgi:hypothetical protein